MSRSQYVIQTCLYFNTLLRMQAQAIYPINLLINFVFSTSNTKYLAELVMKLSNMRIYMRHVFLHRTYRNISHNARLKYMTPSFIDSF